MGSFEARLATMGALINNVVSCLGLSAWVTPQGSRFTKAALFLSIVAFCALWTLIYLPSFTSEWVNKSGTSCGVEVSVMSLHVDGTYTSTSDFCGRDDSTCHHDSCEHMENNFCGINKATKVLIVLAMVLLFGSGSYQVALVLEATGCLPCHKHHGSVATFAALMQCVASVLIVIMLPLWASAKGELPDLTADGQWLYLPENESLSYHSSAGVWMLAVLAAVISVCAALCGLIGAASLSIDAPVDDEALSAPLAIGEPTEADSEASTAADKLTDSLL